MKDETEDSTKYEMKDRTKDRTEDETKYETIDKRKREINIGQWGVSMRGTGRGCNREFRNRVRVTSQSNEGPGSYTTISSPKVQSSR